MSVEQTPERGQAVSVGSDAWLAAYLDEMRALAEKYGITIGGCGCCGSPSLSIMKAKERGGKYTVSGGIVKGSGKQIYLPYNLGWEKPSSANYQDGDYAALLANDKGEPTRRTDV
jgi:hypothetical protein